MEDFADTLSLGNVAQVKTVLASIVLVLALYQVALMAVGYGKVRLPFLKPKAASFSHRAVGDTIADLRRQVLVSLLAAAVIVAVTILAVTVAIGPGPTRVSSGSCKSCRKSAAKIEKGTPEANRPPRSLTTPWFTFASAAS